MSSSNSNELPSNGGFIERNAWHPVGLDPKPLQNQYDIQGDAQGRRVTNSVSQFTTVNDRLANPGFSDSVSSLHQLLTDVRGPRQPPASLQFTDFFNLPFEMRLKIWNAGLPGPRSSTERSYIQRPMPTSLLHAYQESQEETLRCYRPLLNPRCITIYIDPDIDILYINDNYFTKKIRYSFNKIILNTLQHIIFDLDLIDNVRMFNLQEELEDRKPFRDLTISGSSERSTGRLCEELVDFQSIEETTIIEPRAVVTRRFFSLVNFFTKPVSEWSHNLQELFTTTEVEALAMPEFLIWSCSPLYMQASYMGKLRYHWRILTRELKGSLAIDPKWHVPKAEVER
ncbi:hypothetical protein BDZ45DRAFT_798025 [Acephala macrosclerotiorum]|nr:hypothetical protein BDZ45DRAFT_798025 [Acephala macrosclerotiorum]